MVVEGWRGRGSDAERMGKSMEAGVRAGVAWFVVGVRLLLPRPCSTPAMAPACSRACFCKQTRGGECGGHGDGLEVVGGAEQRLEATWPSSSTSGQKVSTTTERFRAAAAHRGLSIALGGCCKAVSESERE